MQRYHVHWWFHWSDIWTLRLSQLDIVRPDWNFGQAQLEVGDTDSESSRILFEGRASNGGFAVDDVAIYEGACESNQTYIHSRTLIRITRLQSTMFSFLFQQ